MSDRASPGTENTADLNTHMSGNRSVLIFTPSKPKMNSEKERLETFQGWNSGATAAELAKAGFYCVGSGDSVRCFCSGGVMRHCEPGENPLNEHGRRFPTCRFILAKCLGNIPASPGDSVDGQLLSQLQRDALQEQAVGGQAAYPQMEREDSRLTTFHNWPTGSSAQPEALARAGFFYTGHDDNVQCFCCHGSLRNWEPGDDPWQEHARWFPRCEFLLQARGPEYVLRTQKSHFNGGQDVNGPQTAVRGRATQEVVGNLSPEEQLKQLQEERTCKVCVDKPVSIVFLPCGHLVACTDCAASLRTCPVCRAVVRGTVRAFMS